MIPNDIYILTGAKNSGKTTILREVILKKENCSGILQVKVNEKRILYNISGKNYYILEEEEKSDLNFEIGRFHFSKLAFLNINNEILHEVQNHSELIIIDEVGSLELKDCGHYDLIIKLLNLNLSQKLLFVTRSSLLDLVIQKFKINPIEVFRMPLSCDELVSRLQKIGS